MSLEKPYKDIPGTTVFDADQARIGYHLNMFCMSLNKAENRKSFKENESAYLDRFPLSAEQRRAVLERDWLGMLKVGGNIYYTIKIAFCDGLTFQDVAGMMSGVPKETYAKMMLAGGRSPEGNRYKDERKKELVETLVGSRAGSRTRTSGSWRCAQRREGVAQDGPSGLRRCRASLSPP